MLPKLLAWIAFAAALLFAVLVLVGLFAGDVARRHAAPRSCLWAGMPLAGASRSCWPWRCSIALGISSDS